MGMIRRTCASPNCRSDYFVDYDKQATALRFCPNCRQEKARAEHAAILALLREKLELDAEADPLLALTELFASCDEETRRRATAEAALDDLTASLSIKLTGAMLRSPDQIAPLVDELRERNGIAKRAFETIEHVDSIVSRIHDSIYAEHFDKEKANAFVWETHERLRELLKLKPRFDKTLAQAVADGSTQHELQSDEYRQRVAPRP